MADTFPKNTCIHKSLRGKLKVSLHVFKEIYRCCLHPTSITQIVNAFSASVFGATLPNPTEVSEVNVKYKAVI